MEMDDLNSTISSILGDPNKMEQLRQVAQSLGINTGGTEQAPPAGGQQASSGGIDPGAIASILQNFQNAGGGSSGGNTAAASAGNTGNTGASNLDAVSKIAGIMGTFNQSDKNIDLLRSLKPHFSETRAGRIDDAVRIMQLMRAWPALRDSGLLSGLGNLFGGGRR